MEFNWYLCQFCQDGMELFFLLSVDVFLPNARLLLWARHAVGISAGLPLPDASRGWMGGLVGIWAFNELLVLNLFNLHHCYQTLPSFQCWIVKQKL